MTAKQIFDMLSDFAWAESLCLQTLLKLWVKNGRQNVILGLKMRGGKTNWKAQDAERVVKCFLWVNAVNSADRF